MEDRELALSARTIPNMVGSLTTGKRPEDRRCYGCKQFFRPHMLRASTSDSHLWRCPKCWEKFIATDPEERQREYQRKYEQRKRAERKEDPRGSE